MNTRIITLIFVAIAFLSFETKAQNWEKLGMRAVNYGLDRDVIPVGAHEGAFTKIKIQVTGGALNMHRIKVEFMNGESQEIEVRHNFSKSSGTRVVDLNGNKRIIKNIVFWYDTKNLARARAKVHVFGRHI